MLCDEIAAYGASGNGYDMRCLLPALKAAQKFTLSPECAGVAEALSEDYRGLARAFPHCRLPFANTWIEVPHLQRPQFAAAGVQAPDFQIIPKRVGWLLTADRPDLSAWTAHLFWSTARGCSCAAMAIAFDMTAPCAAYDRDTLRHNADSQRLVVRNVKPHPGWSRADDSVRLAMLNHTKPVPPAYDISAPVGVSPAQLAQFYAVVTELAMSDWAGEIAYVLAVIGLLNARNATETETAMRQRTARGRPELFEHKVLKIARRQQKRVYGEQAPRGGDHAPMRQYFCRGHFKVRKTGVFFWHPHLRGDASRGRIEKEYELT